MDERRGLITDVADKQSGNRTEIILCALCYYIVNTCNTYLSGFTVSSKKQMASHLSIDKMTHRCLHINAASKNNEYVY